MRMAVYGNRQLGLFFSPVVETRSDGFIFKGKQYAWADVKGVEILEGSGFPLWGSPDRAIVQLRDGVNIKIDDAAFDKRDEPLLNGYSCAFDEVVALFRAAIK